MVVAALLLISLAGAAVIVSAMTSIDRGRAQAVADLVALGAASDPTQARLLAEQNGTALVSLEQRGAVVVVVVSTGSANAIAAAELVRASEHGRDAPGR